MTTQNTTERNRLQILLWVLFVEIHRNLHLRSAAVYGRPLFSNVIFLSAATTNYYYKSATVFHVKQSCPRVIKERVAFWSREECLPQALANVAWTRTSSNCILPLLSELVDHCKYQIWILPSADCQCPRKIDILQLNTMAISPAKLLSRSICSWLYFYLIYCHIFPSICSVVLIICCDTLYENFLMAANIIIISCDVFTST